MRLRCHALLCRNVQGHLQLESTTYNFITYNFLIWLLPLKSSVFLVHFSNAFWHGNEAFPKVSSQDEIVPLLVIFHLPQSNYRGVKICSYLCCQQNQNFSLVSHSCRSCITPISLVSHSCRTRVARFSLVSHSCCIRVARIALVSPVPGTCVVNQTRS